MTLLLCTQCGTDLAPGQRFCSQCGTPTPAPLVESPVADGPWEAILTKLRAAVAPKYQVRRLLGQGGMAGVYLADEPKLGRQVAIKVMAPGLMVDPKLVERFAQEARTIAQLRHANIVTVYEVDERDGLHYFAMDFVAGRTLGQVMSEADRPLTVPVIQAWLYQVGDALAYAHARGVVHRDIKPGNVLLDQSGNALVTDFGIAKVTEGGQGGLTRTGMLVGTPAYMSPEQCAGESVTGASDQYALGAVAYQLLTGRPPFTGPTMTVLHAHMAQQPRPVGEVRADCPQRLQDAVMRMLAKQPDERFPSISAAISAAGASPPGFDDPVRLSVVALARHAATLTVANSPNSMVEGTRHVLEAAVTDSTGEPLSHRKVEWRSDDDEVAAIGGGSALIALAPGETLVKASCGAARAVLELTVEPDPITALRIVPPAIDLAAMGTLSVTVEGRRADGAFVARAALLTSEDPGIARVEAAGGILGVSEGRTVIRARSGGHVAEAGVTVAPAASTVPEPQLESEQPVTPPPATVLGADFAPSPAEPTPAPISMPTPAPMSPPTPAPVSPPTPTPMSPSTPAPGWTPLYTQADAEAESIGTPVPRQPVEEPVDAPHTPPPVPLPGSKPSDGGLAGTRGPARRAPTRLIAAGVMFLLIVSAVVFQALRSGGPPPPPEPAVVQIAGALPAGAILEVRDEQGATTTVDGASISLAAGFYTFEAYAEGHQSWSESVTLEAGQQRTVAPLLIPTEPPPDTTGPPAPETGTLQVAGSLPPRAQISVRGPDGSATAVDGRTASLEPGRYAVRVTAPGYQPWSGSVDVVSGQTQSVTPRLQQVPADPDDDDDPPPPPPPQPGRLQIGGNLPAGATVTVLDAQGGRVALSGSVASVQAGVYSVRVEAPDHEPWTQTVRIQAGQTSTVAPQLTRIARPTPPPGPDPEADQAAIRSAIQDYATAFNRRDASTVVPLLPSDQRDTWRDLLGRRDVSEFSARLQGAAAARLDGDAASVPVDLAISFVSGSQRVSETLQWTAALERAGSGWRITALRQR